MTATWLRLLAENAAQADPVYAAYTGAAPGTRSAREEVFWTLGLPCVTCVPHCPPIPPNTQEYSKDEAIRQGVRTDPICSRGGLSQSTRGGTRRSAHMFASWPSGKRAFVQPWRSAQQWEDAPLPYTIHAAVARSM